MKRLVAFLLGYFYGPCPRCGRMFAGWEIGGSIPHPDGEPFHRKVTCCKYVTRKEK